MSDGRLSASLSLGKRKSSLETPLLRQISGQSGERQFLTPEMTSSSGRGRFGSWCCAGQDGLKRTPNTMVVLHDDAAGLPMAGPDELTTQIRRQISVMEDTSAALVAEEVCTRAFSHDFDEVEGFDSQIIRARSSPCRRTKDWAACWPCTPRSRRRATPGSRCTDSIIVDPSTSCWLKYWDSFVIGVLVLVAFVQPYETAFARMSSDTGNLLNHTVFLIFFSDMLLQFFIAYPNAEHPDIFMKDPKGIAKRYLSGWFLVDFVSASPVELYLSFMGLKGRRSYWNGLRLLRLMRLLRLTHLTRIQRRWAVSWGMSHAATSLIKFLGFTLLWWHWMACLWGGVALENKGLGLFTWLDALQAEKPNEAEMYENARCVYGISLYWAIMTFTSIGYGDITPQCEAEYWIASLCMAGMGASWAYIIGQVCAIMTSMQRDTKFKQTMDSLNWLMHDKGMPHDLRKELRRYVLETKDLQRFSEQKAIVDQMSPMLQGEISMHLHKHWLDKVWYLQEMSREGIVAISRQLTVTVFAPSEEVHAERTLFIVRRGLCIRRAPGYRAATILCNGSVWGEDMVVSNPHLRDRTPTKAVTYLEVLKLQYCDLETVMEGFDEERQRIRWAQIKIALMRAVFAIAKAVKEMRLNSACPETFELTERQRHFLVREVLRGNFFGEINERRESLENRIEMFTLQAQEELECGRVRGGSAQLTTPTGEHSEMTWSEDSGKLSANVTAMQDCLKQLTMKVDCLLLQSRNQQKALEDRDSMHVHHSSSFHPHGCHLSLGHFHRMKTHSVGTTNF